MIKAQQSLEYESAAARLRYVVTDDQGLERKPDAAPEITIYDASGNELVAASSMTMQPIASAPKIFLDYDGQTAEFTTREIVADGTSGATARIMSDRRAGAEGTLELAMIDGTFGDNNAITDSGDTPGAAVVKGTGYTCEYYSDVDISDTDTYAIGTGYFAVITYAIGSREYKRLLYFSVAYYPMCFPIITDSDINELRAHWIKERPDEWPDWGPAIRKAHADLVREIYKYGDEAADYVRREEEMWELAFAWTCREIGRACGFEKEDQDDLNAMAAAAWNGRGMLTKNMDEDAELEEEKAPRLQSKMGR